jgi:hypothetical protein
VPVPRRLMGLSEALNALISRLVDLRANVFILLPALLRKARASPGVRSVAAWLTLAAVLFMRSLDAGRGHLFKGRPLLNRAALGVPRANLAA